MSLPSLLSVYVAHPTLQDFPTRRSSDLRCRSIGPSRPPRDGETRRSSKRPSAKIRESDSNSLTRRRASDAGGAMRSEEHTSELQSRENLVCRLLLEKKKISYVYLYQLSS